MSIPPSNQDMGELPSPNTLLPEPNLNFTVQIHSLLNGKSLATNLPDNNIPGAPVSILETNSQDDNNGAPNTRDGIEAGNTLNIDEADTTSGQGGADPDETSDNGERPWGTSTLNLCNGSLTLTWNNKQKHLSAINNTYLKLSTKINKWRT